MTELEYDWDHMTLDDELKEMDNLMDSVPRMLRRMTALQSRLRNQYGEDGIAELRDAMEEAQNGWMASNC